ncbi:hypothetical protein RchiOBHm_Chr4g0410981 [Rosa chinensis]|uniref:Uncharacterized protein n=1 Tax=Rosa chinensis TaxID=74649 RepID=A0A2P6QVG9_ROSCH|nr:hypothetical protein RchiOBHm_Chr4g0410981 [Rosa chinensis]
MQFLFTIYSSNQHHRSSSPKTHNPRFFLQFLPLPRLSSTAKYSPLSSSSFFINLLRSTSISSSGGHQEKPGRHGREEE